MMALSALAAEATADGDSLPDLVPLPLVFCILTPQSWATQDRQWLKDNVEAGTSSLVVLPQDEPYPRSVVRDELVTHVVEEPTFIDVQTRALAHHATQVSIFQGYYALSNHVAIRLSGREGFALFDPVAGHLVPAPNGAPRYDGLLPCSQGHP
jgi:N-acetyl-1-D-myo-inositol-2-amino-2-deoxy-alpha-D-glucopyranoside deacetylase